MELNNSETKLNLLRAFAGESQARNRYTFAASQARREGLYAVEQVFLFTAGQEKEHAEIFYNHLASFSGENIKIDGGYPIDIAPTVAELLRFAQRNEYEEHDDVYQKFGEKAKEEGFLTVASSFLQIAKIEKIHGDRFSHFADLLEQNKMFVSDVECKWICLNCGYVHEGKQTPEMCPVCHHEKGYFIRVELAPYTLLKN